VSVPTAASAVAVDPSVAAEPARRIPNLLRNSVVFLPALMIAIGGWAHRWVDEDAFINFRIVDQVFAGHGPVFNAGERVESATSTVWLVVLVVARAIFGSFVSMPWIGLWAALIFAVAAFAVAGRAAQIVHRGEPGIVVPLGVLLIAAVTAVWDFSTSGLEMGAVWLWLATCWLVLVSTARAAETRGRGRVLGALAIGLGPLVRPDLALMFVCFAIAWFVLARPRRVLPDLVAMLALPVAYQVFRMGFYATLVPSTALAKDAGGLHLGQGRHYVWDLIHPYALWFPAAIIVVTIALRLASTRDRRFATAVAAMLAAAVLHGAYIVAIGGDYMHARLLLPALFAFALPASLVVDRIDVRAIALVGAGAVWALIAVAALRPPPPPASIIVAPVSDWRLVSHAAIVPKDVTYTYSGTQVHAMYERGVRGYLRADTKRLFPGVRKDQLVATMGSIGVPAWHAGRHVFVIDIGGLAEPLAARTNADPKQPAGHRKQINWTWYDARFGRGIPGPEVAAAGHALTCGKIAGLLEAVDGKLTPGRFISNFFHSVQYTRMKIPRDPRVAERQYC
jgi:arabinofuranosyltransferase